jgi:hypothetical protein
LNDNHSEESQRTQDPSQTEAFMKGRAWVCGTLIVCTLAVTGCSTIQKILPTTAWRQARVRNEGYSLLYQLLSQESNADKILIIKHADSPIADIIKEIANTCGQARKELDLFHEKDRHLNLEMTHLPEMEQKSRAAIQSTVTKQLLFSGVILSRMKIEQKKELTSGDLIFDSFREGKFRMNQTKRSG